MADPGPLIEIEGLSRETRIAWAVIDCAYYHENDIDPDVEAIFAAYGLKIVDEAADG
jgi:DNA polymerase elongation subunit (family B)